MENELTGIQIKTNTRERLKSFGMKGETYDEILGKLMDRYVEAKER